MKASSDFSEDKIHAAIRIDQLFGDYTIQLSPAEAVKFIEEADPIQNLDNEAVLTLLHRINKLVPRSAHQDQRYAKNLHHSYRVGKVLGRRVIVLQFMGFHFPKGYRFASLLNVLEKYAKSAGALHRVTADDNEHEVQFWWI